MTDREGRFWITYNGEIYNYREVRDVLSTKGHCFRSNSDTEVILCSYKQWGAECLEMLNGMFAFAIWDNQTGRLFAARDRLGIKPFYYWRDDEHFVFASEIKALFKSGFVQPEIDYDALHTPAMSTLWCIPTAAMAPRNDERYAAVTSSEQPLLLEYGS